MDVLSGEQIRDIYVEVLYDRGLIIKQLVIRNLISMEQ